MICPMCHRENPSSASFCIMCGHPLSGLNCQPKSADASQDASTADSAVPPAVPQADTAGAADGAPKPPAPAQEPVGTAQDARAATQGTPTASQGAPVAPGTSEPSSVSNAATRAHDGTDGLAVASLVCSIVGIFFFQIILPILGIIFGAVARSRNPKDSTNGKLALAGLIIGIIVLVLSVLVVVILIALGTMAVGAGAAYGLGL